MRILTLTLPLISLIALSCGTSKKTTTATTKPINTEQKKIACEDMPVGDRPHLDWIIEKEKAVEGSDARLPPAYKVYSIDSAQVVTFFTAVKNNISDTALIAAVPLPGGCQLFEVKPVSAKNTPLISISGTDPITRTNTLSLTYNGYSVAGKAIWDNNDYEIRTINNNNHVYYIVYQQPGSAARQFQYLPQINAASKTQTDR